MIVTKRRVCKQACKKGQSGQKQKNGSGRTLDDVSSCSLEIGFWFKMAFLKRRWMNKIYSDNVLFVEQVCTCL